MEGQQGQTKEEKEETYPVHLVGDVAQHDGGANIAAIEDALATNTVVLISWMEASVDILVVAIDKASSTVTGNAALLIDARHGAMRRVASTLTNPEGSLIRGPLEVLLRTCQRGFIKRGGRTYGIAEAPDRVGTHAVDSSDSGVDRVELDAEDKHHASLVGLDVETVADRTKAGDIELNHVGDFNQVGRGEGPHGIVGVRLDDDGKLDLTLELVHLSSVLRLGDGILITGDVID